MDPRTARPPVGPPPPGSTVSAPRLADAGRRTRPRPHPHPHPPSASGRPRWPLSQTLPWGLVVLAWGVSGACSGSALLGGTSASAGDIAQPTDGAGVGDSDAGPAIQPDTAASEDGIEPGDGGPDGGADGADGADVQAVWGPVVLGDSGELSGVFASSTGLAVAAAGDRVLRSAGKGWVPYGAPLPGGSLRGVWTDGAVVVAVGLGGLLARREGPAAPWVVTEAGAVLGGGGPADLWAVSGRSAKDLWAVGDDAAILHYDGVAWTQVHTGTQLDLRAVFVPGDAAARVVAVGTRGRILEATAAGGWVLKQVASSAVTLRGIWGDASGSELFAVGTGGTITHRASFDAVWHGQSSNDADGRDLLAVAGRTVSDLVAVGAAGVILRYEGSAWGVQEPTGPAFAHADLTGVAALPGGAWVTVGAAGGGLVFDGSAWVDAPSAPQADFHALAAGPAGTLWVAGADGMLLRTEAGGADAGWSVVPADTHATLRGLAVDGAGQAWAVGDGGTVVKTTGLGSAEVYQLAVPVDLEAILVEDGQVWAAGRGGTLLHGGPDDPAHLLPVPSGTVADLHVLARGGDGALWAAGGFGALIRREDDASQALATGVGGELRALAAVPSGVLVAGDNGVVLTATVDSVRLDHEAPGVFLYGVATQGGVDFAVGWGGTVLRRGAPGEPFLAESSGTEEVLEAVWMNDARALVAGRRGVLLERLRAPSEQGAP